MVAVNPPGHFLFDPASLEALLGQYSELCAEDVHCRARTSDLFATLQQVSQQMPESWMGIDVDPQMVKFITNISLHESMQLPGEPPLNGPAAIDMWLDAAEGDSSGMALPCHCSYGALPGDGRRQTIRVWVRCRSLMSKHC